MITVTYIDGIVVQIASESFAVDNGLLHIGTWFTPLSIVRFWESNQEGSGS